MESWYLCSVKTEKAYADTRTIHIREVQGNNSERTYQLREGCVSHLVP